MPAFQAGGTGSNPVTRSKKIFKKVLTIRFFYVIIPYSGIEQVVARLAHIQKVVGSTPTPATSDESRILNLDRKEVFSMTVYNASQKIQQCKQVGMFKVIKRVHSSCHEYNHC